MLSHVNLCVPTSSLHFQLFITASSPASGLVESLASLLSNRLRSHSSLPARPPDEDTHDQSQYLEDTNGQSAPPSIPHLEAQGAQVSNGTVERGVVATSTGERQQIPLLGRVKVVDFVIDGHGDPQGSGDEGDGEGDGGRGRGKTTNLQGCSQ